MTNWNYLTNKHCELDFGPLRYARIQDMLILVYKCLDSLAPFYFTFVFHVRFSKYNLGGRVKKLTVPKVASNTFGLNTQILSYFHLEISAR